MKQAISGAMADRKRTMKMGGQKPTQKRWDNRRRDQPQNDRKTNRKTTAHGSPEHFVIEH
jgi:hypothetical protein